jgi:hypothetical protein
MGPSLGLSGGSIWRVRVIGMAAAMGLIGTDWFY